MGAAVQHEAPRRRQGEERPLPMAPPGRSQAIATACAISIAAGIIHAVAMIDHVDHWWAYGVFFLAVTYFQVLWAIWIYRRPSRRLLAAGAIASVAIIAVWVVSRTVGIPFGPEAGDPEPIGAMDIMATIDELVLAWLVARILSPGGRLVLGGRGASAAGAQAMRIGIMLCSASLFALLLGSHSH